MSFRNPILEEGHSMPAPKTRTKIGMFFSFLVAVVSFILSGAVLAWRLYSDDKRLLLLNGELRESQRVGPDRHRVVTRFIMTGIAVAQLSLLFALGHLLYQGQWRYKVFSRIMRLSAPKWTEIVSLTHLGITLGLLLFLSAAARLKSYWMFKRSGSDYQKMASNMDKASGVVDWWFYPRRMLYAALDGTTAEEFEKRKHLWRQSDFEPIHDPEMLRGNRLILLAKPDKSSSTVFADRYQDWTKCVTNKLRTNYWLLGEYVHRNEMKWKAAHTDFSIAFIGQSGSGKTEAMKMWLASFFCMHPSAHVVVCDLKMAGDWDVFGPLCESGRVEKSVEETLRAIAYFEDLLNSRTDYMRKKGYKNIKAWSEAEGIDVPPVLLIIDEFPQLGGPLKFDIQSKRDGTPANVLYKLLTKGRSFGLWTIIGSQFGGYDAIPSEINKNIKVHVCLKTGSAGESLQWVDSDAAFRLGKGPKRPDGDDDPQHGYAYIDCVEDFVRFWYMDDWYIVHEFLKYGVPTIEGAKHLEARIPGIPADIEDRLKLLGKEGGGESGLSEYDQGVLANHRRAIEQFQKTYAGLLASPSPGLLKKKKPLGNLWRDGEAVDQYFARCRAERTGAASPAKSAVRVKAEQTPPEDPSDVEFLKMLGSRRQERQNKLAQKRDLPEAEKDKA